MAAFTIELKDAVQIHLLIVTKTVYITRVNHINIIVLHTSLIRKVSRYAGLCSVLLHPIIYQI